MPPFPSIDDEANKRIRTITNSSSIHGSRRTIANRTRAAPVGRRWRVFHIEQLVLTSPGARRTRCVRSQTWTTLTLTPSMLAKRSCEYRSASRT